MAKNTLFWINPLAHHVYDGWLYFFSHHFNLRVYDSTLWVKYPFVEQNKLMHSVSISIGRGNFFNLYRNSFGSDPKDIVIVGDIFTNSLCLTMRGRNIVYYTEYFLKDRESFMKRCSFSLLSLIWSGKKILVPTKKAYDTWKRVSNKVFYLPQLFFWEIHTNDCLADDHLKILYAGHNIDDPKKNVRLLVESVVHLSTKYENISLTLLGRKNSPSFMDEYGAYVESGLIRLVDFVAHEKIHEFYCSHNLFVLPSVSDPIWAVLLEAMAHSLPIIASNNVGAADYVIPEENGYIFDSGNREVLISKIEHLLIDPQLRSRMGGQSYNLVKDRYWTQNSQLLSEMLDSFTTFTQDLWKK